MYKVVITFFNNTKEVWVGLTECQARSIMFTSRGGMLAKHVELHELI